MPEEKTPATDWSKLPDMARELVEDLTRAVVGEEKAKDAPTPVTDLVKACDAFLSKTEVEDEGARWTVMGHLSTPKALADALSGLARVKTMADVLRPHAEVRDRAEGDARVKALTGLIESKVMPDALVAPITDLVTRWNDTAPARGKGGKGEGAKPLGFTVRVNCDACGRQITETDRNDHNSLRHQCITHARKEHNEEKGKDKGPKAFDALTKAVTSIGLGKDAGDASEAKAEGFTFRRAQ